MPELRYYVDQRSGCVAVIDRTLEYPDRQGLHSDIRGVVKYWGGKPKTKKCHTCGTTTPDGYEVVQKSIAAAYDLAYELNEKHNSG